MGYTTNFRGNFNLDKPLTKEHSDYLVAFSRTRRMRRNESKASAITDDVRVAANLPIGTEGAYFGELYT